MQPSPAEAEACVQVGMWLGLLDCFCTGSAVCVALYCPCPDSVLLLVLLLLFLLSSPVFLLCSCLLLLLVPCGLIRLCCDAQGDGRDLIIVDTSGRHKQEAALFEEMRQVRGRGRDGRRGCFGFWFHGFWPQVYRV